MTRTSRNLTVGFIVTLGLAGVGRTASAGQAEPLTITLCVHDYARVPRDVLTRAENEATRIYRTMGVELVWLDASPTSARPHPETISEQLLNASNRDLTISILSGLMVQRTGTAENVMGVAPGTLEARGRLAYVFYERIEDLAQVYWQDTARILGHVMAHEMGHLLLPYNAHSKSGIMRANWDLQQLHLAVDGLVQFSPEQAELIRSNPLSGGREH